MKMDEGNQIENTGSKKWMIVGIVVVIIVGAFFIFSFVNRESDITGEVVDTEVAFEGEEMEDVLTIVTLQWNPYVYVDERGLPRGIFSDVMDYVARELDISYKIEIVPWTRALRAVQIGEADALVAAYNKERESFLYYTEEQRTYPETGKIPDLFFYKSDYVFFVRKYAGSFKFESFEQLKQDDYRIGLNNGFAYTPEVYAAGWNTVEHVTLEQSFESLNDGKIDFYLLDKAVGLALLEELGLSEEITFLPKVVFTEVVYLPFSKNSDYPNAEGTMLDIYEEIRKMHEEGVYDEIYRDHVSL